MCGRFYNDEDENTRILTLYKKAREEYPDYPIKSGEIYPGEYVPVLGKDNKIYVSKWGLDNPYRKNAIIINSREETIGEKFKKYFENTRIVIPCTGYYEWNANKEKYYFYLNSTSVLFMCGICTGFSPNDRFSVITREAPYDLKTIHHRMPVILDEKNVTSYLHDYNFAKNILKQGVESVNYSKCEFN